MNNSNPTLRKAYKVLGKITKKMGNPDLYYSAQLGVDSSKAPTDQAWSAFIAPPREGLAPITFAAYSKEEFIQRLDDFLKNKVNEDELEVVFHEAQIESNNRSILHHQEQIDLILNPKQAEEVQEETKTDDDDVEEAVAEESESEK